MESQTLLQQVRSFVAGNKSQAGNITVLERSRSAMVLMRSLPCARAAVLEQICEIFQEAVHKHIVESDRQDLLGAAVIVDTDPEVHDVIQSIYDTLLEFINNNPEAWAPIITKWSVYLLGQLSTKYAGQRGTKSNLTLNEKLQMWMTCPATQMLMEISAHCFSKLIDSSPDICVNCLLDSAVKHSPHFDWVVAYIGSYFYKSIINHLLRCALNEFHNEVSIDEEDSNLFETATRILDYFALQYPKEVTNCILTMFQGSLVDTSSCLIPFFIHLGTHASNVLNVLVIAFLDQLTPDVMVKLYLQLSEWGNVKGNYTTSLLSSVVGLIISLKQGTYRAFQFLLGISLNIHKSDTTESETSSILNDIQQHSTVLLEQVFVHLQRLVWRKHHMTVSSSDNTGSLGGSKESSREIPFLDDMKDRLKDICHELLNAGNSKLSWYLRLLSLVAVYSGPGTCVEVLEIMLTFRATSHTLSLYVQVQKELQSFFPRVPDQALEKCLKKIAIKSSPDILTEVQIILENLQKLMGMEKNVGTAYTGWATIALRIFLFSAFVFALVFSVGRYIKRHSPLLLSFLLYPSRRIASVTLDLLLALSFPFAYLSVSDKTRIVRITVSFFFKVLHEYNVASFENKNELCSDCLEMLKKHQSLLTVLCQDEACQLLTLRHLMEGACHQENKSLFSKHPRGKENASATDNSQLLLEKNLNPGISSRLSLNTASVFYFGVIGKGSQRDTEEDSFQVSSLTNAQFFLQSMYSVCYRYHGPPVRPDVIETARESQGNSIKILSTLALLLKDLLVPEASFDCSNWPDEEIVRYSIERDIKIRKQFDDSEILWHLLSLVADAPHLLLNCLSIVHALFSSVVKFWEQNRAAKTTDTPSHLHASVQIMSVLRKAMWLPKPLCFIGDIFHIIAPKEVHLLLATTWEFLRENPPNVNTKITDEMKDGHHKDVIKSIFLGNIADLGHLYARFFPLGKT